MGHAIFVFGAAGAGKTTFCRNLREKGKPDRNIKLVNLDPAYNEATDYDIDLYDHITVQEVMENEDFGPNGALFYALKEMVENIDELRLQEFEDEYFVLDCPGQIELFLHSDIMVETVKHVSKFAKVAIVYLTDASNFQSSNKYMYSSLCATLSMSRFCLPVINIVSKADLLSEDELEKILYERFDGNRNSNAADEYKLLEEALLDYVDDNGMMDYMPCDWDNESMVENILIQIDNILQRYDDAEPKND